MIATRTRTRLSARLDFLRRERTVEAVTLATCAIQLVLFGLALSLVL